MLFNRKAVLLACLDVIDEIHAYREKLFNAALQEAMKPYKFAFFFTHTPSEKEAKEDLDREFFQPWKDACGRQLNSLCKIRNAVLATTGDYINLTVDEYDAISYNYFKALEKVNLAEGKVDGNGSTV
jgi:hypothetical protein